MAAAPALPAGHALNEYRIDKLLGVGGFGLTYLATDENLNLPVALKEYLPADISVRRSDYSVHPGGEGDRETFDWGLSRFLDEARTLATFRHSNIVRVMRFFQANQTAYMVMEFVKGASLSDWIKPRRPLNQAAIIKMVAPLVEGLGTIHRAGYLHRDVKPGNIYIREDGSPVLLDFGAARAQDGRGELTAIVSPGYAPLEQYSQSSHQGPWSDLYAMGGVMYWMVTGSKPVDATARVRDDPQVSARRCENASLYSPEFLDAIDWALAPDERLRPRSAAEFLGRLSGFGPPVADNDRTRTLPLSAVQQGVDHSTPSPSHPSSPSPSTPSTPSAPSLLDAEQLREVESELAKHIGPLAAVLVKKASKKYSTIEALVENVASEIEDEAERAKFTRRLRGATQPPSRPPGASQVVPTQLAAARFDMAILERAEKRLAQHIGALARVVVKKAAMKARDESELYLLLADQIEDPNDRKAFIKKAISISGRQG